MSVGSCTCSAAVQTSAAQTGTAQAAAAILVQRKAMQQDASSAAQLIAALPQPLPPAPGGIGSLINIAA